MGGDGYPLVSGYLGLKNDVATCLMDFVVVPATAEVVCKRASAEISRGSHPIERTSSRTRCNRMDRGLGPSKKYPSTAFLTLARSSSQVSAWVTMFSVRHSAT